MGPGVQLRATLSRLAEPCHAWLPSVAWPAKPPVPTYKKGCEWCGVIHCLGVRQLSLSPISATQLVYHFGQVTSLLWVSVSLFKTEIGASYTLVLKLAVCLQYKSLNSAFKLPLCSGSCPMQGHLQSPPGPLLWPCPTLPGTFCPFCLEYPFPYSSVKIQLRCLWTRYCSKLCVPMITAVLKR